MILVPRTRSRRSSPTSSRERRATRRSMTVVGRRRRPLVSTSAGCINGQRAYPQRLVLVAARLGAQRVSVFVVLHTLAVFRDGDAKNRRRVLVHPTGRLRSYRVAGVRPTTLTPSTVARRPSARSFVYLFVPFTPLVPSLYSLPFRPAVRFRSVASFGCYPLRPAVQFSSLVPCRSRFPSSPRYSSFTL